VIVIENDPLSLHFKFHLLTEFKSNLLSWLYCYFIKLSYDSSIDKNF